MDLEMKWDGNPNIVLDINTHIGVTLPVQVFIYSGQLLDFLHADFFL